MKFKYILIIAVFIFGAVFYAHAQTIQSKAGFFIPKNAIQDPNAAEKLPSVNQQYQRLQQQNLQRNQAYYRNNANLRASRQMQNNAQRNNIQSQNNQRQNLQTVNKQNLNAGNKQADNMQVQTTQQTAEATADTNENVKQEDNTSKETADNTEMQVATATETNSPTVVEDDYKGGIDFNMDFSNPFEDIFNEYIQDRENCKKDEIAISNRLKYVLDDFKDKEITFQN